MERVIIVGGGVAGLTCLNALLDCGISAILFEGGTIGNPKMCGEFIAPSAVSLLQHWGISAVQSIEQVSFMTGNKKLNLQLPSCAGAFARNDAELLLAERAKAKGGQIRENSPIQNIISNADSYTFQLASGETIETAHAIIATGKLMNAPGKIDFPYYGIKAHFPVVAQANALLMYSTHDAYFGLVPVSKTTSNFACLVKSATIKKAGSGRDFFNELVRNHSALQAINEKVDLTKINLLESKLPHFGFKKRPNLPNIFWIGDALVSFPPAIGYGFAHSVDSAMVAVEYFLKNNSNGHAQISRQLVKSKLKLGNIIHKLLLNPSYAALVLPLFQKTPWVSNLLMKKIGY